MLRSSSSAALVAKPPKVMPTRAEDYELQDEIGQGVSAKVRAACRLPCYLCLPGFLLLAPDAGRPPPRCDRRCTARCASPRARLWPSRFWTWSGRTPASWYARAV
jgi:hypothetical protein